MEKFDLIVIGGGPGGYTAAIHGANAGLSVALVEGRELGGTCLNRGCIPSKTWLKNAEILNCFKESHGYGITVKEVTHDIGEMVNRKNEVIQQLQGGIKGLLRQSKVTVYEGFGEVGADKTVSIEKADGKEMIQGDRILLTNGSKPFVPPVSGLEDIPYFTSDTIFDIEEVPAHIVIMGGGVIGLEIGCVFNALGSQVEIVEMADRILAAEDPEAAEFLKKQLADKGMKFHTGTRIVGFKNGEKTVVEIEKDGKSTLIETDAVLAAAGRVPNLKGLEGLQLAYDGRFVKVDTNLETSIPGIYAAGDLIGGYQLAHAATEEGVRAVKHILGESPKRTSLVPRCVYTFPEVASIGMTKEEAEKTGYRVKTSKSDLRFNGKALAAGEAAGFMKIIADEKHGEILGVVMVGSHVTEMISQATAFMHLEGTVEEMESMVFPHPTMSESLNEAAKAWFK